MQSNTRIVIPPNDGMTCQEIADVFCVSRQCVSAIEIRALKRIRRELARDKESRDLLNDILEGGLT